MSLKPKTELVGCSVTAAKGFAFDASTCPMECLISSWGNQQTFHPATMSDQQFSRLSEFNNEWNPNSDLIETENARKEACTMVVFIIAPSATRQAQC